MKTISLKILVILLPFVVFLGFAESRLTNEPKIFSTKSEYIKIHKDEIEILFMGNSTMYSAIIPDLVHPRSYNLGLPGEPSVKSLALAVQLSTELESLNTVVIGLNYTSFFASESVLTDGDRNYWRFFDMSPKSRIENTLAFFSLQPKFIVNNFLESNVVHINDDTVSGLETTGKGHYYSLGKVDLEESAKQIVARQTRNAQVQNLENNLQRMSESINRLEKTGIRVVLLRLPTYSGYYLLQDEAMLALNQKAVRYLLDQCTSCEYIDDSHNESLMQPSWYIDSFHFSFEGACQFSEYVKERLLKIEHQT